MKKKLIIFIIAMAALLAVAGGTYAYFTNSVITHNVISSGRVKVELIELADLSGKEFEDIKNAMPGDSYDKIVLAKNSGESDAWVRIGFVKAAADASGKALDASAIGFATLSDGWLEKDGWFYYDAVLKPGESTKPIAGKVSFPASLGNIWQNASFTIDVTMEAVQVAHNGTDVMDALGWPDTAKGDS